MGRKRKNPELLVLTNPLGEDPMTAYERFHWTGPATVEDVEVPEGIEVPCLIKIGDLEEVIYTTNQHSQRSKISSGWTHKFKNKPHLCTTERGDVLIVFGGGLHVTPRGIEG